ncbi:hypothetical protein L6V77_10830 [Myxococcota bacterium]|nr:hypothetical protein [Myxococcota bacterium]
MSAAIWALATVLAGEMQARGGVEAAGGETAHDVAVSRVEARLGVEREAGQPQGFEVRLEAVRAATPESLFGVDGNSLVVRVKRAWAYAAFPAGPLELEGRAGLLPVRAVAQGDEMASLRALSPGLGERGRFLEASDVGGAVAARLPDDLAGLELALTVGEGRREVETNDTLDLTVTAFGRPWTGARLAAWGRRGRQGPGGADAHRFGARAEQHLWRLDLGVEYHRALGYDDVSERDADAIGAWVTGAVLPRADGAATLGAVLRYERWDLDYDRDASIATRLQAGLYHDVWGPEEAGPGSRTRLRAFLAWQLDDAGINARSVPGAPASVQGFFLLVDAAAATR